MSGPNSLTPLANISRKDTFVNVFAVVKYFRKPMQTRGTQKSFFLSLVDPTLFENEASLKCVFFENKEEDFPIINNIGDIVKFTSLGISLYNDQLQGRNKRGFSWITFDGRPDAPVVPRFSPKSLRIFNDADKKKVEGLKSWAANIHFLSSHTVRRSLDEITLDSLFFDLLCHVVAIDTLDIPNGSCILHVWDGTVPVAEILSSDASEEQSTASSLSATKWSHKVLGKCVKVFVFRNDTDPELSVSPGQYILITNLHLSKKKGTEEEMASQTTHLLTLREGSSYGRGITVMSEDDPDVKRLVHRMEALPTPSVPGESSSLRSPPTPAAVVSVASETSKTSTCVPANNGNFGTELFTNGAPKNMTHKSVSRNPNVKTTADMTIPANFDGRRASRPICRNIEITSIKALKASRTVPGTFRCRARLFAYMPKEASEFVKYVCQPCKKVYRTSSEVGDSFRSGTVRTCVNVHCGRPLSLTLLFSLILWDSTGFLDVIVCNEDAKVFFPDIEAVSLATDDNVQQWLHQRMSCLLMSKYWMEYEVNSCYVEANLDGEKPIMYGVSGTRFPVELEESLRSGTP